MSSDSKAKNTRKKKKKMKKKMKKKKKKKKKRKNDRLGHKNDNSIGEIECETSRDFNITVMT